MANGTNDTEQTIRTRRDVWNLNEWDDVLLWYARAVAEMRTRPLTDPTGWRYQAAIHEYDLTGDPYAIPGEQLPSTSQQDRFWSQCQHGSWYFLSWHRIYLGYFERIVGKVIVDLGGPADWTLPYWNYSDTNNADARKIPPAFRAQLLPDGSPNALRVEQRAPGVNAGLVIANPIHVDLSCLLSDIFAGDDTNPGFGGPETEFSHSGGTGGFAEGIPHGSMHVRVGGRPPAPVGFMTRFYTAALDPIFWLHHANIDRLWAVWNDSKPIHTNPIKTEWLDQPVFEFHDENGVEVTMTSASVGDTEMSPFAYTYEDISNPLAGDTEGEMDNEDEGTVGETGPSEMVGATDSPILLDGGAVSARIQLEPPTGPGATEDDAGPRRTFVFIENIIGSAPVPHTVYINLPAGADPEDHPEKIAGSLSMFGLPEASGEDPQHPGSGLNYSLDVTRFVDDPNDEVEVALVPEELVNFDVGDATEGEEAEVPVIEVGRISVYRGG